MFFLALPISAPAQGSSVVVVVAEISHIVQSVHVYIFWPLVVVISQIVHIFLIEKSVSDPEEKCIV